MNSESNCRSRRNAVEVPCLLHICGWSRDMRGVWPDIDELTWLRRTFYRHLLKELPGCQSVALLESVEHETEVVFREYLDFDIPGYGFLVDAFRAEPVVHGIIVPSVDELTSFREVPGPAGADDEVELDGKCYIHDEVFADVYCLVDAEQGVIVSVFQQGDEIAASESQRFQSRDNGEETTTNTATNRGCEDA
jgi:hypothetical protein